MRKEDKAAYVIKSARAESLIVDFDKVTMCGNLITVLGVNII